MKAATLYKHLENDFVTNEMWDEWAKYMGVESKFATFRAK